MLVLKADGTREIFSKRKIATSLIRIGLSARQAQDIANKVRAQFTGVVNSDHIFRTVIGILREQDSALASRYNLRRAVMNLGPTGFPFEHYIARLLTEYGFETEVDQSVAGFCVNHEVDVMARDSQNHYLVECKYHNTRGARSDLKVALYVWARFLDIKRGFEHDPNHRKEFHNIWLITNTRCTSEAISYAECVGMRMTSWGYPQHESLEHMINQEKAYPINIFPELGTKQTYAKFFEHGIVLAKDLLRFTTQELVNKTRLNSRIVAEFRTEAERLCANHNNL